MGFAALTAVMILALAGSPEASSVPSCMIYCDQDDFDEMQENWSEEIEIDCTIVMGDTVYAGSRLRIRGDSSRGYPKKSYRITFPLHTPLEGRTEWNFNGEYEDPTYMHTWLFARIMEALDFPCFGADHVRLYVNDQYRGLYMRTDPVDEAFLTEHSMDPLGNLYKAEYDGSCLSIHDDVDSMWVKETNVSEGWNDLYGLISFLDLVEPESLHVQGAGILEFNSLLTMVAVNTLTSNYSTYYHNYFLYRDITGTGLWTMMPWDVDKTFGSWVDRPYSQGVNDFWYDNTLFEKIILDPVLFEMYFQRMQTITDQVMNIAVLGPMIDSLEAVLEEAVSEDNFDAITVEEFHAEVELLRSDRIPTKMGLLQLQYEHTPRSFRAWQADTISLGTHSVRWERSSVQSGGGITYGVYLSTKFGLPDSVIFQELGLTDTVYTFTGLEPGTYWWWVEAKSGWRTAQSFDHINRFTVTDDFSELSGTLSGTTVLGSGGSPYLVTGDILIPEGSRLYIEAGVDLRFAAGTGINCPGYMAASGGPCDSVRLVPDDPLQPWGGVRVSGEAEFSFVTFSGSVGYGGPGADGACLEPRGASVTLEHCSFNDNIRCINVFGGTVLMDSCSLTGWNRGELFFMDSGERAVITDCRFGNMVDPTSSWFDGIEFQRCTGGEFRVSGCEVFNIDGDCIDANGSDLILEDLLVSRATDKGISIGVNPSAGGEPSSVQMRGLVVLDCVEGISVKDGSTGSIDRCTVSGCETGIRAYEKTPGYGGGIVQASSVILVDNGDDVSSEDGSSLALEYSITGGTVPWPGEGNLIGSPDFEEWGGGWRLSPSSPCIDAGDPSTEDADGTRADMGAFFFPQSFSGLRFNEAQPLNTATIADEYGQYDDWVEIYNGTGYDCDLSWVWLSDDPADLTKYRMPAGTVIPAGGFMLVWMDGHWWEEGLHAPWRLSASGDSLMISREAAGAVASVELVHVDDFVFGQIGQDLSWGRMPDGGAEWMLMEIPTPGASNTGGSPDAGYLHVELPYPNPAGPGGVTLEIIVDEGWTTVDIYDLSGRLVQRILDRSLPPGSNWVFWDGTRDGSPMPDGLYLIHVMHAGGMAESRKLILLQGL